MGIVRIIAFVLLPIFLSAQDWPRFELYQLKQGIDSGQFVTTGVDSNLDFNSVLRFRFQDSTLLIGADTVITDATIVPILLATIDAGLGIEVNQVNGQIFIESLSIEDSIYNGSGSIIEKGTPLYAADTQGNYWDVAPARADDPSKMPVVVIAGEEIGIGEVGLGLIKGHIKQVNTTGLADGSQVYVDATGGYTSTKPTDEGVIIQRLGTVIKGETTNGSGIINLGDEGFWNDYTSLSEFRDTVLAIRADIPILPITLGTQTSGDYVATATTYGDGISGSATGEGSTFTVTSNATTLNTPNTLVFRDASGNFKANIIEANLAGTANQTSQSLTAGYGLSASGTFNGFIARTFSVDTSELATLNAVQDTALAIRADFPSQSDTSLFAWKADSIKVTSSTTDTDFPLIFSSATTTGYTDPLINSNLTYNPSTTELILESSELIVDNDGTGFSGTFKQTGTNNVNYSDGSVTGINTYYNLSEEILNIAGFSDDAYIFNPNVDGNIYIGTNSGTNPSTAISITDDKKVGINKPTPSYTLDVSGDINFTGLIRKNATPLFEDSIAYIWINDSTDHYLPFTGYYNDLRAVVFTITATFNGCVLKELTSNAYGTTKEFRLLINGSTEDDYETDSTSPYSFITISKNTSLSTGDYIEIRNDEGSKTFTNTHIFHIRCPNS
jgi:hypothetical protein